MTARREAARQLTIQHRTNSVKITTAALISPTQFGFGETLERRCRFLRAGVGAIPADSIGIPIGNGAATDKFPALIFRLRFHPPVAA